MRAQTHALVVVLSRKGLLSVDELRRGVCGLPGVSFQATLMLFLYRIVRAQTHALVVVLSRKGLLSVDELRRGVEGLPAAAYLVRPYYEKWARALTAILLERRVLSRAELDAALGPANDVDPPVQCATLSE